MIAKAETQDAPAQINWPGRLDGGTPRPEVWRGKISACLNVTKERFGLANEESARDKLEELKQLVKHFYVKANPAAVVRCIDGRSEEDTEPDNSSLGPQVPGGTAVTSVAYRFSIGLDSRATIESDVDNYRNLLTGMAYIPGGHEDEHNAEDPENTGCGAIDKMLEIMKVMGEYDTDESSKRRYRVYEYAKVIASAYMDEQSFDMTFQDIIVKLQALNGPHFNDHYFQKDKDTDAHLFRSGILDRVREGGRRRDRKTVERLVGEHKEVFLMVNYVDGETFDRDGFAASTENKAQAFNYDVWVINERAKAIFPDDVEKQRTMLVTNIMYAVGTAMVLTDGSLELGVRSL